jgi:chromosome segregation ATPase
MKKVNFDLFEKEYLVSLLEDLQSRLHKKNDQLKEARMKLNSARTRLEKMKSTVEYQRRKILELRDTDWSSTGSDTGV